MPNGGDAVAVTEVPAEGGGRSAAPAVDVRELKVHFPVGGRWLPWQKRRVVRAVDDVSFRIHRGKTLGLVGESGCGKTTLALAILQLRPITSGEVLVDGEPLSRYRGDPPRSVRRQVQLVFQNPAAALDPRMTIGQAIGEPLVIHGLEPDPQRRQRRVEQLLARVG